MGYQGTISRQLNVNPIVRTQYEYFGPFRKGDVIRGLVIQAMDQAFATDAPLKLGLAIFSGQKEPAGSTATFAAGRQLVAPGADVGGAIPFTYLPASPDDSPAVAIPINYRSTGDEWLGVYLQNAAVAARVGGIYIDTDIGAELKE